MGPLTKVAAPHCAGGKKGQTHGRSLEPQTQSKIRMLLHLQRIGDPFLHGSSEVVAQSRRHVSYPSRNDFFYTARSYELVKLDIGNRSDQGEFPFLLPDYFITTRKWDKGFKAASHRHDHTVFYLLGDGFVQATQFVHGPVSICSKLFLQTLVLSRQDP